MIKFHPIVFAVVGFASAAGETPTVDAAAGRYIPFPSLTLLARAGNNSCGDHALGSPSLHIEDEHIASAFQIKASCCQRIERGLREWEGWTAESIELRRDALSGRDAIQSTVEDDISKDETSRLATILGFHTTGPSSEAIIVEICTRDVAEDVPKYPRELYVAPKDTTAPLDMVERARTLLNALRAETGMTKAAVPALREDVVVGEMDGKENDGEEWIAPAKKDHALVKGKKVATPPPTNLMSSALEACPTSHVNALVEVEEGGASAFEEAMLRGLGGADANRMKSMTLEMPQTYTLAEIHVSGDIALGSVDECALSLASEDATSDVKEYAKAVLDDYRMRGQNYTLARILTAARNAIQLSDISAAASTRAPIHTEVRSSLKHERLTMSERRVMIERRKEEAERLAQEPLRQEEEAAKRAEKAARKANEDQRLGRQQNMRERENPQCIQEEIDCNDRNLLGTPRDCCDTDRMMAFATEWLKNQSTWMQLSNKYYLKLLWVKPYDKFYFEIMKRCEMLPFYNYFLMVTVCYSFIAFWVFTNASIVSRGFPVCLSSSTRLGYQTSSSHTHTTSMKLFTRHAILALLSMSSVQSSGIRARGYLKINNDVVNAPDKHNDAIVDTINLDQRKLRKVAFMNNDVDQIKQQLIVGEEIDKNVIERSKLKVLDVAIIDGAINKEDKHLLIKDQAVVNRADFQENHPFIELFKTNQFVGTSNIRDAPAAVEDILIEDSNIIDRKERKLQNETIIANIFNQDEKKEKRPKPNGKSDKQPSKKTSDKSPKTESPTTANPTIASPTTPSPTTASPTTASPTTASPTTASPTPPSPTPPSPTPASPTTPSPTTPSPTTPSPTTASPTTASPTTASPTTASPTTASPTTASPTPASPTTPSPTTPSPTTPSPTTPSPTTASPTTASPTTQSPTTASPTAQSPTTPSPTTPSPTTPSPTTPSPTTASPTTASPTTASPTTISPTTASPTTQSPTTQSPTTQSPTTPSPTTPSPTTPSPTTASPTTASPTTPSPTSVSPTSVSPTSASPTTASPTTASPTTASPTTQSPTTASPTTPSPTTPSPTTPSPTTASPTTPSPTTPSPTTPSPTTASPTTAAPSSSPTTAKPSTQTSLCFKSNAELKSAVDSYIDQGCSTNPTCAIRLKFGEIGTWCTSLITDMSNLFLEKQSFNESISGWDVSNVTNMNGMFNGAFFFNQPLNSWNVSSVTTIAGMFAAASTFNQTLNSWDVSKVTNMNGMFAAASTFNQPLSSWIVSSVTTMEGMFQDASSFNQPLNSWNVSNVTNMANMFTAASTFNQTLNSWDVSKVTYMAYMFLDATNFNQDLSSWDVSKVTNMRLMFADASSFNQPLNSWNVSKVTDMDYMFMRAISFNQILNGWDVSSVTTMVGMFQVTNSFNESLNSWNVSKVTNMAYMFWGESSFNQILNGWDVSSVTNMQEMFHGASSFNQSLSGWNVSSVTNMRYMFLRASSFNTPLNQWDVSSVTDMAGMFNVASNFNQNLGGWNISSVLDMSYMFNGASSFNQNLCPWGQVPSFPYGSGSTDMFQNSGCTNTTSPIQAIKGPFCASSCQIA